MKGLSENRIFEKEKFGPIFLKKRLLYYTKKKKKKSGAK